MITYFMCVWEDKQDAGGILLFKLSEWFPTGKVNNPIGYLDWKNTFKLDAVCIYCYNFTIIIQNKRKNI